jgi:hypothetical protein
LNVTIRIMKKVLILIFGICIAIAASCQNFTTVRVANSDSTHGTANGTIYRGSDGLLRFMYGGIHYRFAKGAHVVYTASNGLIKTGNNFALGGTFTGNTDISGAFDFTMGFSGVTLNQIGLYASLLTLNSPNIGINGTGTTGISGTTSTTINGGSTTTSLLLNNTGHTFTGKAFFTPTVTLSGFNIGSLAGNPSSLTNGDAWYNSTLGLWQFRQGGSTVGLGNISGSLTSTQVGYGTGINTIGSEAGFEYTAASDRLLVGNGRFGSNSTYLQIDGNTITHTNPTLDFSITTTANASMYAGAYAYIGTGGSTNGTNGTNGYYTSVFGDGLYGGHYSNNRFIYGTFSGSVAHNNAIDLKIQPGAGYPISGNGNGGSIALQVGQKRAAGGGVDGSIVLDALTGSIEITATPPNNNANTQILSRNSVTRNLEYRDASTFGTVTSVSGTSPISVATGTTTPVISLPIGSNQIVYGTGSSVSNEGVFTYDPSSEVMLLGASAASTSVTLNATAGINISSASNTQQSSYHYYGIDVIGTGGYTINQTASGNLTLNASGSNDVQLTTVPASGGYIIITALPTSCAGAPTGAIWNNAGVLSICP